MLALRDIGGNAKTGLLLLVTIFFVAGIFFSENAFLFAQEDASAELGQQEAQATEKEAQENESRPEENNDQEEALAKETEENEVQVPKDDSDVGTEEPLLGEKKEAEFKEEGVMPEQEQTENFGQQNSEKEFEEEQWEQGPVIINEIAWMGTANSSSDEWLELRNTKKEQVDLDGWILKAEDGTPNVELKGKISSEGYFLLERTDESTVPDVDADQIYTGSLDNSGEHLRLIDGDGQDSDRVNCSDGWKAGDNGTKQTMQLDEDGKWKDSKKPGGTPGLANHSSEDDATIEPGEKYDLVINELLPNPQGPDNDLEWMEIFNNEDLNVDLSGWKIKDASGKSFIFGGELICPKCFRVLEYSETKIALNNSGDELFLYDSKGVLVDAISYGDNVPEDFSFSRKSNGEFELTPLLTPGQENKFPEKIEYSNKISINEFLPNPEGKDQDQEWVEIFNSGEDKVDLEGWSFEGESSRGVLRNYEILAGAILSQGFYVVEFKKSPDNKSFSIGNADYKLRLLDPNGKIVDIANYSNTARSGLSYNRTQDGQWRWSRFLTPGRKNRINSLPNIKIKKPKKVYKDLYAEFDASKTKDANKDKLKFRWDFGDGHRSYLKETKHKYEKKGKYVVELQVDDGSEKVIKSFKIQVESFPKYELGIVGLVPNPKGKDLGNEIVVISNYEKKKIDLVGYYLATGASRKKLIRHPIYDSFVLGPGEFEEIFNGELCKFSLRNSSGFVALLYPNGKMADIVQYQKEKISDDEMYKLVDGRWEWIGGEADEFKEGGVITGKDIEVAGEKVSIFDPTIEEEEQRCICLRTIQIKNLLYSWKSFLKFLELPV